MKVESTEVAKIHHALQDDVSRFLFEKRLLYSLTGDEAYIRDIALSFEELQPIRTLAEERTDNFIFGAGTYGDITVHLALGHFLGIFDNDAAKWGGVLGGATIVSPEEIRKHPESRVFLAVRKMGKHYQDEILQQLQSLGVAEERIVRVDQAVDAFFAHHTQYFDLPELPHVRDEAFVDAGSFDGATSKDFVRWAGEYQHIYAFEADPKSQPLCRSGLQAISSVKTTLLPYGVWSERTELHLNSIGPRRGQIDPSGDVRIPVTSIDQELAGKRITFIKMDIEGAEMKALQGASRAIAEQHPKLAICLYHHPEHILSVPLLILSLYPGYRFYLRHYTFTNSETVLYAF